MRDFVHSMKEIENLKSHSKEEVDAIKDGILNMAPNPRDTQFQGFADMVWDEIMQTMIEYGRHIDMGTDPAIYRKLIARRAYDLVKHAFTDVDSLTIQFEEVLDMTELPKETS